MMKRIGNEDTSTKMTTPKLDRQEPSIRKVYVPKGKELDTLKHTYDRYYQMKDNRDGTTGPYNYEGDWDKWEKQWNAWRPVKDADDWKSNIYIPITTSVIEAELSEVIEMNLRPWVVERGQEDSEKAKVMNAIIDYTWEKAKSDVALFDMIKDAFIFGTGIGMEYYWKQPRTIKDDKGKDQKILEYDDCYLEPVRLWDFYVDERARDFSGPYGAQDCIRRYVMDYDDFRNFFENDIWNTFGNVSLVKPGGDTNYYEFYQPPERMEHDREVEVLWYWNKPDDLLSIVANDVLVTAKPNPYKHKQLPFVRILDVKKPYQFYGKGEAELLESLQEENNTLRRMIIDRNHLDIDKPILVSDTLTIEDEDTITRPHGVIPVGDVNAIKVMEYNDIPQSVFKSLDLLTDDKVRVTGMDERQESVSTAGTATEAAILKEQTIKRINMKMWQLKNDAIIDIGRLRVENIMQFYSQPKLQEILGEDEAAKAEADGTLVKANGKKYQATYRNIRLKDQKMQMNEQTQKPELIPTKGTGFFDAKPEFFLPEHGGFDIKFAATESIPLSKPLKQQKIDEMYDRLSRNPSVDPWALAEAVIKSRDLDPDKFKAKQAPPQQGGKGQKQGQGQPQQQDQGQQGTPINLKKIVDLAGVENAEMMQGKKIGPTPYAPVVHTEIHIEFMKSDNFKQNAPHKVTQLFANHVMGELAAQKLRGGQGQPSGLQQEGQGGQGGDMTGAGATMASSGGELNASANPNVAPGQIQGGGDTQNISGAQSQ
jgi:hypothetical protein